MKKIIKSLVLCSLLYALSFPLATEASLLSACLLGPNCKLQTSTPSQQPTKESSQVIPLLKADIISGSIFPKKTNPQNTPVLGSSTTLPLLKANVPSSPVLPTSKSTKKQNDGCTAMSEYSTTTGKPCTQNLSKECASGHLFSFLTGKRCNLLR